MSLRDQLQAILLDYAVERVAVASDFIAADFIANSPVGLGDHAGPKLVDSYVFDPIQDGVRVGVRVSNTSPQAIWVHDGTPPHPISAHNSKNLLVWMDYATGETVFVNTKNKPVQHPGTTPNLHFDESADRWPDVVDLALQ